MIQTWINHLKNPPTPSPLNWVINFDDHEKPKNHNLPFICEENLNIPRRELGKAMKDEGGHRMNRPKFQDTKRKALKDSAVKQEYDRLQPGYDLVRQLLHMRMKSGLTQEELAKKPGTKKPNISRLESPSHGQSPRLTTIKRYAEALSFLHRHRNTLLLPRQ